MAKGQMRSNKEIKKPKKEKPKAAVVVVANSASLAESARKLNVTAPAVTQRLRALEERVAALEGARHCVAVPSGQAALCLIALSLRGIEQARGRVDVDLVAGHHQCADGSQAVFLREVMYGRENLIAL